MKKASFFAVALVMALGLLVPMTGPVMAHWGTETTVTISASSTEVCAGDTVILTITETNTGDVNSEWNPLHSVWVELEPGGIVLDKDSLGFSGDAGNDGLLHVGETWQWTVSVQVDANTTYTATGHGLTTGGFGNIPESEWENYDVTWPEFETERDSVTVTALPCNGGGEGFTPGFWKNHLDDWGPTGLSPTDLFAATFGLGTLYPGLTLGEAIAMKGGKCNALVRHGTAALLNATHSGVDYGMTEQEVLDAVSAALIAGECKDLKNELDELNNMGGDLD